MRIIAAPARLGLIGDLICIWDAEGKLEYQEFMGEEVVQLITVGDNSGQKRALVLTATRLLIAP